MSFGASTFATLQLASGVLEAVGQVQEGGIEAQAQEFAAGSDLFNADIARQESKLVQAKAKIEIGRQRKAQKALVSEQQVLFAISGVRIDEGTPLIVMKDTLEETELDILLTQFNADVESQRLESQARFDELRSQQRRGVARGERTAASIRAGKTLLASAATFGQKFSSEGD